MDDGVGCIPRTSELRDVALIDIELTPHEGQPAAVTCKGNLQLKIGSTTAHYDMNRA